MAVSHQGNIMTTVTKSLLLTQAACFVLDTSNGKHTRACHHVKWIQIFQHRGDGIAPNSSLNITVLGLPSGARSSSKEACWRTQASARLCGS